MSAFLTGGTLVVSDLFIKTLQSIGVQNFQSFPVLLINPDTSKQRSGYFLFNVLGLIGAADLNSSSYDMLLEGDSEGGISPMVSFDQLSLDKKKLGGLRLFRLAEDPTVIVIDETVKLAMKKNRPKDGWGVMFEELDAE